MGNDGWRRKPKAMSLRVFERFLQRAKEHAAAHAVPCVSITFHGGEPLLQSPEFFACAAAMAKAELEPVCEVSLAVQTNAVLLNERFIDVFNRHDIVVGVSLDGAKETNDRARTFLNGRGSYDQAVAGMALLKKKCKEELIGGLLAVISVNDDPIETVEHLVGLGAQSIDFLEPTGHWDRMPPGKAGPESTEYADWLIAVFDWWFHRHPSLKIRRFENIIEGMLGGYGTVEYFGTEPVTLITIATDGAYEAVDQVKSVKNGIEVLSMNVFDDAIDNVLSASMVSSRQSGLDALSDKCVACEFALSCGGGYFPHRYSDVNGFRNPSVYCADYMRLFSHIRTAIEHEIGMDVQTKEPSAQPAG